MVVPLAGTLLKMIRLDTQHLELGGSLVPRYSKKEHCVALTDIENHLQFPCVRVCLWKSGRTPRRDQMFSFEGGGGGERIHMLGISRAKRTKCLPDSCRQPIDHFQTDVWGVSRSGEGLISSFLQKQGSIFLLLQPYKHVT